MVVLVTIRGVDEKAIYFLQQSSSFEYHLGFDVLDAFSFLKMKQVSSSSSQSNPRNSHLDSAMVSADTDELKADLVEPREEPEFEVKKAPGELEREDRAERRKRHVRLFCFSCNRYEGHSIAARSRLLYSFLIGITFGLYHFLGRFSCHCCGTVRLARYDWLNVRFLYRTLWIGGSARAKKSKAKSRTRRKY